MWFLVSSFLRPRICRSCWGSCSPSRRSRFETTSSSSGQGSANCRRHLGGFVHPASTPSHPARLRNSFPFPQPPAVGGWGCWGEVQELNFPCHHFFGLPTGDTKQYIKHLTVQSLFGKALPVADHRHRSAAGRDYLQVGGCPRGQ